MAKKKSVLKSYLPSLLVLALLACVTGYWFLLTSVAQSELAKHRQQTESKVKLECETEDWGGFPFRVTFSCVKPKVTDLQRQLVFEAVALETSFPVYNPRSTTTMIDGPSKLINSINGEEINFTHTGLTVAAKIIQPPLIGVQLTAAPFSAASPKHGKLTISELDLKIEPQQDKPSTQLVRADAKRIEIEDPSGPFVLDNVHTTMSITDAPQQPITNGKSWLREAAKNGSVINVEKLSAISGELATNAKGEIRIDPGGYIDGKLSTQVKNLKVLLAHLQATKNHQGQTGTRCCRHAWPVRQGRWCEGRPAVQTRRHLLGSDQACRSNETILKTHPGHGQSPVPQYPGPPQQYRV